MKDLKTREPILRCNSSGDLYPLTTDVASKLFPPSTFVAVSQDRWHQRLGHPGNLPLLSLKTSSSICFPKSKSIFCQSCVFGKGVKLPFRLSTSSTFMPFDIIHSDIWTSPIINSAGHRYYLLFLDDFSNFLWTYPLTHKSQTFSTFTMFAKMIKTQFGRQIKQLQCDNGKEYANTAFTNYCHQNGMLLRFSCPYTSSQNGKAERKIRSINNMVRTLLAHASLPNTFWHHALEVATYLLNILPTITLHNDTPTHLLYQRIPSYDRLRVFGCLCYPILPPNTIHKLQNRSIPCVFLGYPHQRRGYKCLDLSTNKIIFSRHVDFDESTFPFSSISKPPRLLSYDFLNTSDPTHPYFWPTPNTNPTPHPPPNPPPSPTTHPPTPPPSTNRAQHHTSPTPSLKTYSRRSKQTGPIPSQNNETQTGPSHTTTTQTTNQTTSPPTSPPTDAPPTRSMITRSMDGTLPPPLFFNFNTTTITPIPPNPKTALSTPDWYNAMSAEFNALINNKTWDLVPRSPDMHVIRSMWLFRHKFKSDGTLERYKARLVCDGRTQQVGIDCGDTFSPVVKPATIRTVLSIALSQSWCINQLDVTNAFLHGNLLETVYMYQPMGFRHPQFPDHVCRLKKSLYGLKQAPRAWYQRFTDFVTTIGFIQSKCDNSLFILRHGPDTSYLLIYVDDIILTASSEALRLRIMHHLSAEFAMKDLGPLNYFLGIKVIRQANSMFLSQQGYAIDIITRAGMTSCKPINTPVDSKPKLSEKSGPEFENPTLYRSLAGALQYLTFTRPDISYVVQQICIHMHSPRVEHWNALKRIIRYIQGTSSYGLTLGKSTDSSLRAFTDADWAGCPDTRRSTSGYCVYLGDNLLSWSSKRQSTISRSSAEAEYRGIANVVAELCWLRNLLLELHRPILRASLVYCDNVSAIYLSGNPVQHQRTKHIELDIHFVREKVQRGQVRVLHVPSRHQVADIFTKGLPKFLFDDFRSSLSIRPPPASTAGV